MTCYAELLFRRKFIQQYYNNHKTDWNFNLLLCYPFSPLLYYNLFYFHSGIKSWIYYHNFLPSPFKRQNSRFYKSLLYLITKQDHTFSTKSLFEIKLYIHTDVYIGFKDNNTGNTLYFHCVHDHYKLIFTAPKHCLWCITLLKCT